MWNRRGFVGAALGAVTLTGSGPLLAAGLARPEPQRPVYRGPNVILVRYGGGVRRRETIDPAHSYSPYLMEQLRPRGVLFSRMELTELKSADTSHGQGTLNLLTGRYDGYVDVSTQPLSERFEPTVPTLFESLRKQYDVAEHETLIVNGEDRADEDFYTFSNHADFGIDYRSQTLSLYRFKRWLLAEQLAAGGLSELAERQKRFQFGKLLAIDHRQSEQPQGPELTAFWQRWRATYGDTGLKNARGDRLLTQLALRAMGELRPRFMMINYQDPDYVHWGIANHYTRGIAAIDDGLRQLTQAMDGLPFYRDNTLLLVVPDCGRDNNPYQRIPYQHHFNSRSAHEIWALAVGPGFVRDRQITRATNQIDVTSTIAARMGLRLPDSEGSLLRDALT